MRPLEKVDQRHLSNNAVDDQAVCLAPLLRECPHLFSLAQVLLQVAQLLTGPPFRQLSELGSVAGSGPLLVKVFCDDSHG